MAILTENKNYLQPSQFKIVISRRDYPNLVFFARGVTHPGAEVNSVEVSHRRVTLPTPGDRITYGQLTLDVLVDEEMESYIELQQWLERLVQVKDQRISDRLTNDSKVPTYNDISVIIMSSANNKVREIKYKDCLPVSIGSLNMQSNTGDVTYLSFAANFRFSYYEIL